MANLQDQLGSDFNNITGYLEREIECISFANMGIAMKPLCKFICIDTAHKNDKVELKDFLNYYQARQGDITIFNIFDDNCMSIFFDNSEDDVAGFVIGKVYIG